VAARWTDPAAFRADPSAAPAIHPSRRQTLALLLVLVLVAGAVAAASLLIRPDRARAFDLLHGSVFIEDQAGPVAVDLANVKPTFRLLGAEKLVSAKSAGDLSLVALDGATLLLNRSSGEFNIVDNTGFAVKHDGSGVQFGRRPATSTAAGFASGKFAYIERTTPGSTDVYLVSTLTAQAAVNSPTAVKARAAITIKDTGTTLPGGAAAANGDLWLLLGSGPRHSIRQLSVPPDSSSGAALTSTGRGSVVGVAAIATGVNQRGRTDSTTVVGVASSDRIQLFTAGSPADTVHFPQLQGVDSVLPASSAPARISFLIHSFGGWSLVSVGTDGKDLRGPTAVQGVAPQARLVPPAASFGELYTMDRDSGSILQIGPDARAEPVPGASTYPTVRNVEVAGYDDAYVMADGPRVIVDSATHIQAIGLFADGSRAPQIIRKSNATTVNATGGAEALTRGQVTQTGKKPIKGGPKPKPQDAQPINNKIDCKTVTQKPHIPTITSVSSGSRTATLQWTYPTISPQDCIPSTYEVSVKVLSVGAPSAPASVRVQSQTGTTLSGLFPSTQYAVTLTAFINGEGTSSSPPTRVTTGPEGPAAPTNLQVAADPAGNWVLSWESCGSARDRCVDTASWKVIPTICDGRGLTTPPSPIEIDADPSTRQQPPARYRGGDALLGRGLQFQVEGVGVGGAVGDASPPSACVTSWSAPDASAMRLSASQPDHVPFGAAASTTVTLALGSNPVQAVGGVGARVFFRLTGPGGTQISAPITYTGAGNSLAAKFDGVQAGADYTATATVSAPGHSESSVTLGPEHVTTSADWPPLTATASCAPVGGVIQRTCDLTVQLHGLAAADVHGEQFDLVDSQSANSQLRCGGGPAASLDRSGIDPAAPITLDNLSLLFYNGACTVTLVLQEAGGSAGPLVFGGTLSPVVRVDFTIGAPTTYTASPGDFSAAWDSTQPGSVVRVESTPSAPFTDDQIAQLTQNWHESLSAPDGTDCGSGAAQPTRAGILIGADAQCVHRFGSQPGWTVVLSYDDAGTTNTHSVTPSSQPTGPPPGFVDCAPSGFSAYWGKQKSDGVTVSYAGDPNLLLGCSSFAYTLQDQNGATCGTPDSPPAPPGSSVINVSGQGCEPADGWKVAITWHNDNTGNTDALTLALGSPPSP
jgi:Fibronectin type III domain